MQPQLLTPQQEIQRAIPTMNYGNITFTVERITPAKARDMLRLNTANRPLTASVVKRYSDYMEANSWPFTGDPIKISNTNVLLDGQHRLEAIVSSGKSIDTLVIRGLDPATFTKLDQGKKRNTADMFALLGVQNYATAAAIVRSMLRYESDSSPTLERSISYYESHKDVVDEAAHFVAGNKRGGLISSGPCGGLFALVFGYYLSFNDYEEALDLTKNYILPLVYGHDLSQTDARFVVRRKLIQWAEQGSKPSGDYILIMLVKATNLWLKNREVKSFRMPVVSSDGTFDKPAIGE